MSRSDLISSFAVLVAFASFGVAAFALLESKRTNRLTMYAKRSEIYDAFHTLAFDAMCQGKALQPESVLAFERYAVEARKLLPTPLDHDVENFYSDCEMLVAAQSFVKGDADLNRRVEQAAARVHATALKIDRQLLQSIRRATDA